LFGCHMLEVEVVRLNFGNSDFKKKIIFVVPSSPEAG